MRSIQTKIILLILMVIVVSASILGGAGIISSQAAIDNDSVQIMNLLCSEKAEELNSTLGRIEQSVEIMAGYADDNIVSLDTLVNNEKYRNDYTENIENLGRTAAAKTEGAVAYYMRFSPDIISSNEGFFMVKNGESGVFEPYELTDFSKYDPEDIERLGWYYIPVKAGKAVWLEPYYNKNIDIYMISYVEPIYIDGEVVGIVGMDIDFTYLSDFIGGITLYDTGYAALIDNMFNIVYQRDGEDSADVLSLNDLNKQIAEDGVDGNVDKVYDYTLNGKKKRLALRPLNNGMCLAVTAPVSEIDAGKIQLIHQIVFAVIVIALVFIIISSVIAKRLIRPLKQLNTAAKEIASGNLSVTLATKSKDEIGALTDSFRETVNKIKEQMNYINSLAFTDSLTGISNNTAYLRDIAQLKKDIENGTADFSVTVIDVNGLKRVNDNYGHDLGNILITTTANAAAEVFGKKNIYRIGGDEFAAILKNTSLEKCGELSEKFTEMLRKGKGAVRAAAATGSAVYDSAADKTYEEVFRRADEEMYKIKEKMKENKESSVVLRTEEAH